MRAAVQLLEAKGKVMRQLGRVKDKALLLEIEHRKNDQIEAEWNGADGKKNFTHSGSTNECDSWLCPKDVFALCVPIIYMGLCGVFNCTTSNFHGRC